MLGSWYRAGWMFFSAKEQIGCYNKKYAEDLNIKYWVDGGWGVDILTGKQNRDHRDIDIDFDSESEEVLLDALKEKGYKITTDWSPSRIELHHPELGYLDIQ